jgi:AcrR family transcriptional regulator
MRQKLLDATLACLAEKGYAATSTTEVVRRAGVSRGALNHHFASKADLVAEAAATMIGERLRATRDALRAAGDNLDLEQRLRLTWDAYERWFAANIEFMVAARTDEALRASFTVAIERNHLNEARGGVDEQLWLQGDDAPLLTQYVFGCFIRGLCLERIVNGDAMVEEIFARFIRLLDAAQKGMVISDGPTQR